MIKTLVWVVEMIKILVWEVKMIKILVWVVEGVPTILLAIGAQVHIATVSTKFCFSVLH